MSPLRAGEIVALIPARGGSKGVPGKNVARIGGVPLVARAVAAALAAGFEDVRVTTDDAAVAEVAAAAGAGIVERPAELAGDTASSESALLHALDVLEAQGLAPRAVAFLQATSPFLEPAALRRAADRVLGGSADSVLAAFETYAFLWRVDDEGAAVAVNHDAAFRPRRQDRQPHYQETGAFYVLRTDLFRQHRHRFFGRIALEPVSESRALEVDSAEQLELARGLAPLLDPSADGVDVDAVITDFDGVHTDDTATVATDGVEAVRVNRSDGMGVERLLAAGVPVVIVSKERNAVVAARAAKLRIPVLHGVDDKASAVRRWCGDAGIDPARVAYVGNDVNDLPALEIVGWPIAVADAHPAVRAAARLVLTRPGGHGAVREVAELVLSAREGRNTRQ
ncbi:MAG TPA: acylneuraminate cytidylyltransferase [Amnibacterium sp.]|jgi:N-acylneuraminate cytidylyltransferase|nr:acylneuraminate cytidylyltransferase [Amnibacterium sp.]